MKNILLFAPLLSLMLATAPPAGAASVEGQVFDEVATLANRPLRLNGLGVRAVSIIRAYAAGLYLPDRAGSLAEIAAMPGPKRLQLRMLLGAGPDDFNKALVSGIRKHSTETQLALLQERIGQLEQTISAIGQTGRGDVIDIDFVPDLGTTVSVNGVPKGMPIAGADFYLALLGIFLDERPVDRKLKQGLLGQ